MLRRRTRIALLQLVLALTSACDGPSQRWPSGDAVQARREALAQAGAFASHIDVDGTTRFVRALGAHEASPGTSLSEAARIHVATLTLPSDAQRTLELVRVAPLHGGEAIAIFGQRVGGVDVLDGELRVLVRGDGSLVAISGHTSPFAMGDQPPPRFTHRGSEAIDAAIAAVDDALGSDARAHEVLVQQGNALVTAWSIDLAALHGASRQEFRLLIRDSDLRVLDRGSRTQHEAFQYRVWADPSGDLRPNDGPLADHSPHATGSPDGARSLFIAPTLLTMEGFNSPGGGPADPWLAATATQSLGNNVDAYTDSLGPDGFSAGDLRATVTAARTFDRSYDVARDPLADDEQRMAAVTQAFYTANWLHDWWYDSGFDEAAGNAQASNYGRGGIEGDPMRVEIQNGAPGAVNNSSMSTPADGRSPTMEIMVWQAFDRSLQIEPVGLHPSIGLAEFGPTAFDVSASMVQIDDGAGVSPDDGCETPINSVVGQIVLVHRGTCSFKQKALNAEGAGAIGIVIANDVPFVGAPPMVADGLPAGSVTIPVVTVSAEDGSSLEAALAVSPLTATLHRGPGIVRDGGIDNTLVAHEWGHYLHHRLAQCSAAQCLAMSEGWGDFNALMMMLRPGDRLDGTYAIAGYAGVPSIDPVYFGIRRYPYSIDPTKNGLTFRHIADGESLPTAIQRTSTLSSSNFEAHNAGEVWAAMLWEGYAALLAETERPGATRTFADVHRAMSNYVVGGLMMTPPDATYTEARDAILTVAGADEPALAEAFARRGAGSCAVSPDRNSLDFVGVVESFVVAPRISIGTVTLDDSIASCDGDGHLGPGERGRLTISLANGGGAPLVDTTLRAITSALLSFSGPGTVTVASIDPFDATSVAYEVELEPSFVAGALTITVTVENAAACTPIERRDVELTVGSNQCTAAMDAAAPDASVPDGGSADASPMVAGASCACTAAGASRSSERWWALAIVGLVALRSRRVQRAR